MSCTNSDEIPACQSSYCPPTIQAEPHHMDRISKGDDAVTKNRNLQPHPMIPH
jgi:hypothetical protein